MAASFFFYDLETSGINPRTSRTMQFAGQRTSTDLKPIGEPVNELIALTPDVLPDPDAILLTGITPQQAITDGHTEASFLELFYDQVVKPDTIYVGFNSIRFDDEFMRFLLYRNFYDAYEWEWQNGASRWDILDVVRMTRALRPDGIQWPFASDGKPSNRLELLTSINKLDHRNAHDALGDVNATIAVASLIAKTQPDLFNYLLSMRSKKSVAKLVEQDEPFVYTSSHYSSDNLHTTAVIRLAEHPNSDTALVYDLRHDPTPFLSMSADELVQVWRFTKDPDMLRLPVKTLKYNRAPAIAPLGVIKDAATEERIKLPLETVKKNLSLLRKHQNKLADAVLLALKQLDAERELTQSSLVDNQLTVDERLYEGFIADSDKKLMREVHTSRPEDLDNLAASFSDSRLQSLLPLYKARNFRKYLTSEEKVAWDVFCAQRLTSGGTASRAARYFERLKELAVSRTSKQEQYLLEELRLYGESILLVDATG